MKAKEYFYDHNFLDEVTTSISYTECNRKELDSIGNKFYCFLLKKFYKAKNTAIDYCNKVAYLQFDHAPMIEDERLSSAKSRIIEIHYPDLKTLVFSVFKRKQLA